MGGRKPSLRIAAALLGGLLATAALSQPPQANGLSGARALIDRLYATYARDHTPEVDRIYTLELRRSIRRQSDGDLGLGYDPLCNCQDTGHFSYRIVSLVKRQGGATARVDFSNFGERHSVTLQLAYRGGRWLIGDIIEDGASLLRGK